MKPEIIIESLGLFAYFLMQLGIGYWVSRRIKDEKDYLIGGRSVGVKLASFSIFATWFGAETCMGSSSAIFQDGLAGGRADPFGYTICLLLMSFFLAHQLRSRNLITLADLFHSRYSPSVEKIAVLVMVPTSLFWAAAQIRALGQIVSVTTDINIYFAVTVASIFVITYTFLGGLLSDMYNDLVQGIILIAGMIIMLAGALYYIGSLDKAFALIPKEKLSFTSPDESILQKFDAWMIPILGSLVTQEMVSRILACRSPEIAKRASLNASFIYLFIGVIPVFLGLVGGHFNLGLEHSDEFLPKLAKELLHPILYIIFLGALLAAILSTVDSTLLSFSALVSHNLVSPALHQHSPKRKLLISRMTTLIAGIIAYSFAMSADRIYDLNIASSLFGTAGVLVITIAAIYTKFGSPFSAISCLIVGTVMTPLGKQMSFEAPFLTSVFCSLVVFVMSELSYRRFKAP